MTFKERLAASGPIIMDGAMGTSLFNKVPNHKGPLEILNIERPDVVEEIHSLYIESGAELIETNSFGGSMLKLSEYGLSGRCIEINEKAAAAGRRAADKSGAFVGGSVGPTGLLVEPMGNFPADEIYNSFRPQMKGLENGGADVIIIETMTDIQEAKLALLAAKIETKLPVICSLSFDNSGKTMSGTDMLTAFATLSQMGADVVGANCSMGPDALLEIYTESIDRINEIGIHLSVWANAGFPEFIDGKAVYTLSAEKFAATSLGLAKIGVKVIGGCCGTNPVHIRALSDMVKKTQFKNETVKNKNHYFLTSRGMTINLKKQKDLVIVGERLNPTARKKFAEDLKTGSQSFLRSDSKAQVADGAHVLDINVGVPGIDEISSMHKSVYTLTGITSAPLMIDSDNPAVIEKALMTYPGVPIVNSINGNEKSLREILPIIKKFGCFVVTMCLDETGIHRDSEKRIAIGEKLVGLLESEGISNERIFIDPLILTESAEPGSAVETVKVIKHFSSRGIKTSIGLSNVSFGLPQRKFINNVFLKMAVDAGLTAAILNPTSYNVPENFSEEEKLAFDFLSGADKDAVKYISYFKGKEIKTETAPQINAAAETDIINRIYNCVVEGNLDEIEANVMEALNTKDPKEIMDLGLLKALEKVGDYYSTGEYFLPQMISSANAMKKGFLILKPLLTSKNSTSAGRVVICTVKGDIHDIGKNIVAMMLENHGFEVHDLGKDVDIETITEAVNRLKPDILCLSSLLTTTMNELKVVSDSIRSGKIKAKLLVGGAVVNEEYATGIGAFYGTDAVDGVNKAKQIIGL